MRTDTDNVQTLYRKYKPVQQLVDSYMKIILFDLGPECLLNLWKNVESYV